MSLLEELRKLELKEFSLVLNPYMYDLNESIPITVRIHLLNDMEDYGYSKEDITIEFIESSLEKLNKDYVKYTIKMYCMMRDIKHLNITQNKYDEMISLYNKFLDIYSKSNYFTNKTYGLNKKQVLRFLFDINGMNDHAQTIPLMSSNLKNKEYERIFDIIRINF